MQFFQFAGVVQISFRLVFQPNQALLEHNYELLQNWTQDMHAYTRISKYPPNVIFRNVNINSQRANVTGSM